MVVIANNDKSNNSNTLIGRLAHPMAASVAGAMEIAFFHPADTVAKRLMSNQTSIMGGDGVLKNLNRAIFKDKIDAGFVTKVGYLYPGSMYAFSYKVLQRVYKFAGQPIVKQSFDKAGVPQMLSPVFGSQSKFMTESLAGSCIGIGEILLLPLDRLKIMSQTNDQAMKGRSLMSIVRSEGMGLYAGAGVTAMRNAPGSFCLFGGAAFTKETIFGLQDITKASVTQNLIASGVGAVLSIVCTNPLDVIKTRIQNKDFGQSVSGGTIMRQIMKEEGPAAFFKAVVPKTTATAPKVIFSYTATQYFYNKLKNF